MKLILLDGGPASGKNTLGILLVQLFQKLNNNAILLDLDKYVEQINSSWIWQNKQKEKTDQQKARNNFAKVINKYLQQDFTVIAIGERFLTKENIINFINKLKITSQICLIHLSIPFSLRMDRLTKRGPHSLINLEKDQKDRDLNVRWYGYIYENINTPTEDAENIMKLIQNNKGLLNMSLLGINK